MNFFKGCCTSKDVGEPAKKTDPPAEGEAPKDDAAAAEAKPEEVAPEAAPEAGSVVAAEEEEEAM
jgi:hypothetical protein